MSSKKPWKIRIDTGGTFTDCVGIDPQGHRLTLKVLSSGRLRATVAEVISPDTLRLEHAWLAKPAVLRGMTITNASRQSSNPPTVTIARFDDSSSVMQLECTETARAIAFEIGDTIDFFVPNEEAPILAARLLTATGPREPLPSIDMRLATTRATNALLERTGSETAFFVTKGLRDLLRIGDQTRPELFELNIQKSLPLTERVYEVDARLDAAGQELVDFDEKAFTKLANQALQEGATTAAIAFMHSVQNAEHENTAARILQQLGFEHVAVSSTISPLMKILPRAETAVVDAYVGPTMKTYLQGVDARLRHMVEPHSSKSKVFGRVTGVMMGSGGLKDASSVHACECLLSGPAAGVVGAVSVARSLGYEKIIGFDMGGTSTDVSRYDGEYQYRYAQRVGDARILAPALAIETVAAGGGSICAYRHGRLCIGPESAGADPGPACYGRGGPLTLTDLNVLLGRIASEDFTIPIDENAAEKALQTVLQKTQDADEQMARDELIAGFLAIANQRMADAIEQISIRQGVDPQGYALVSFGGAGGQHACAVAELLGIKTIIMPRNASLLSAVGIGHAGVERIVQRQVLCELDTLLLSFDATIADMKREAMNAFSKSERVTLNEATENIATTISIAARLKDQGTSLDFNVETGSEIEATFRERYQTMYGHLPTADRPIEVETVRLRIVLKAGDDDESRDAITQHAWKNIVGPTIINAANSSFVISKNWTGTYATDGSLILQFQHDTKQSIRPATHRSERIERELIVNQFVAIASEMGELLERTAMSTNVKERRDFSCAIFDANGQLLVNAPHVPVHLGGLGLCVREVIAALELRPGDTVITNHPRFGGSHLPDVTLVTPVFDGEGSTLIGFVANRAHHAEIGGSRPGSMPPDATSLAEEGVIIPPTLLVEQGNDQFALIENMLREGDFSSRSVADNLADLRAQLAANQLGKMRLAKLAQQISTETLQLHMQNLFEQAKALTTVALRKLGNKHGYATARLDDDWQICINITIEDGSAYVDFSNTTSVHPGNLNATPAIVRSAVIYVFRLMIGEGLPLNEAIMQQIDINLPECFLNPKFPDDAAECPAVVGGNTEVSQRIVDALLEALDLAANGPGTMNNLLFGNDAFGYYETIGGGSGAGPGFHGTSGVHCHMTNTRMTDSEILEQRYPVRVREFSIRNNSGGDGKFRGGDGLYREIEFLAHLSLSVLTQRRAQGPSGLHGGGYAWPGSQKIIRADGLEEVLDGVDGCEVRPNDRIVMKTPGGGGWHGGGWNCAGG